MTAPRRPGVSVVIPVRGRVALLRNLLTSLQAARKILNVNSEVLVVDDSCPAEAAQHRRHCQEADAKYVEGPRRVGTKRNLGARNSRYDHLVFVDSDCEVDVNYLVRIHTKLLETPPNVAGVAGLVQMTGTETSTLRLLRKTEELNQPFGWPTEYEQITWSACANLAVRTEAFWRVNGFDEDTLTVVGGEDVDLGVRLTEAGYMILCEPEAIVFHSRKTGDSVTSITRRLFTYGRSSNWLNCKHPERRQFRLNPVSSIISATSIAIIGSAKIGPSSLAVPPIVAIALFGWHARRRMGPGDRPTDAVSALVSTALDWSFDLGEFVGAFQVRRPHYMFFRFGYMDTETFRARQSSPEMREGEAVP